MSFTDDEIQERAQAVTSWPKVVVTLSGRARNIALVVSELHVVGVRPSGAVLPVETPEHCEHLEHVTLDADIDATEWALKAVAFFNESLREGEPARSLVRVVDLGPSAAHAFVRMPAGGSGGELFKCKCGLVVSGRPSFNAIGDPYTLSPPPDRASNDRRRFFEYCGLRD